MKYFEKDEIRDKFLSPLITDSDIEDAEMYIEDLAMSLDVSPDEIETPTPYKVKKLAMYYTLMVCARNSSKMNVKGNDGIDAYEMKRRDYQREVDRLTSGMTAEIMTGKTSGNRPGVITLERA